jgi:mutator protein MutT
MQRWALILIIVIMGFGMAAINRIGKGGAAYKGKQGAGIIYTDGKQILLLKRSEKGDHNGTWGIPGGKAERGETPIDTAIRECKEECGHGAEGSRFDKLHTKDGSHSWTTFFYAVDEPFDCTISDEHSDWKWVKINDLNKMNLHPKLKEHLPSYLSRIRQKFGMLEGFARWVSAN